MAISLNTVVPMVHHSRISVPYTWWAGETASRFLRDLHDRQTIMGTRCEDCRRVFVPPRKTCPTCFTNNATWVTVANEGTLVTFSVARRQLAAIPATIPEVFGLIRLDGADTALLHRIDGIDPEHVAIGMRVKACFSRDAGKTIKAISHFEPV